LIAGAFNQLLPKLYGISMMWTLNERRHIRSGVSYELENDMSDLTLPKFTTTVRLLLTKVLLLLIGIFGAAQL